MKRTKKRINCKLPLTMLLPVCIILLVIGGVTAYAAMTATDKKENSFQIGIVETTLKEDFTTPAAPVEPGDQVAKKVYVTNSGSINQFVRVMVQPEIIGATAGGSVDSILPSKIGEEIELVGLDTTGTEWIDGEDGYYYYLKALKPEENTSNLFTHVKLKSGLSAAYHDATFTITIKVETSNCAGDKASGYGVYQDAWWQGNIPTSTPLSTVDGKLQNELD